jgi:hypothetical protein
MPLLFDRFAAAPQAMRAEAAALLSSGRFDPGP